MVGHGRAPGVQHRCEPDAGAEMLGIGRDGEHRLGGGLEQEIVDRCLVLIGDGADLGRQRKDDMEVRHCQQLGLACLHPIAGLRALTLRAVPVAAAVVGDARVAAGRVLAARDMPAESRGAAALDGTHYLQLIEADVTAVGLAPSGAMVAEDIRDLQQWPAHRSGGLRRRPFLLQRQMIEWARDRSQEVGGNLGIFGGRFELGVSEQNLDDAHVGVALQQMGCEAVPQSMGRDPGPEPSDLRV